MKHQSWTGQSIGKDEKTAKILLEIVDFLNEFYFQAEQQANQNNKKY